MRIGPEACSRIQTHQCLLLMYFVSESLFSSRYPRTCFMSPHIAVEIDLTKITPLPLRYLLTWGFVEQQH